MSQSLTPIDQIRLEIGDKEQPYYLTDEEIQFYLDKNNGDIEATVAELMPIVLVQMSSILAREREGQVEVYQGEKAKNMLNTLKYFDDSGRSVTGTAYPITKGVTKSFNQAVDNNEDSCGAGVEVGMFSQNTMGLYNS